MNPSCILALAIVFNLFFTSVAPALAPEHKPLKAYQIVNAFFDQRGVEGFKLENHPDVLKKAIVKYMTDPRAVIGPDNKKSLTSEAREFLSLVKNWDGTSVLPGGSLTTNPYDDLGEGFFQLLARYTTEGPVWKEQDLELLQELFLIMDERKRPQTPSLEVRPRTSSWGKRRAQTRRSSRGSRPSSRSASRAASRGSTGDVSEDESSNPAKRALSGGVRADRSGSHGSWSTHAPQKNMFGIMGPREIMEWKRSVQSMKSLYELQKAFGNLAPTLQINEEVFEALNQAYQAGAHREIVNDPRFKQNLAHVLAYNERKALGQLDIARFFQKDKEYVLERVWGARHPNQAFRVEDQATMDEHQDNWLMYRGLIYGLLLRQTGEHLNYLKQTNVASVFRDYIEQLRRISDYDSLMNLWADKNYSQFVEELCQRLSLISAEESGEFQRAWGEFLIERPQAKEADKERQLVAMIKNRAKQSSFMKHLQYMFQDPKGDKRVRALLQALGEEGLEAHYVNESLSVSDVLATMEDKWFLKYWNDPNSIESYQASIQPVIAGLIDLFSFHQASLERNQTKAWSKR